jgi:hypothetical protein
MVSRQWKWKSLCWPENGDSESLRCAYMNVTFWPENGDSEILWCSESRYTKCMQKTPWSIEIGWGWVGRRRLSWWSQYLFRCLETADRGENVPCRNASSVTQHNTRSFIKLGFLNRHKRSVQSTVSADQLLISAICMLILTSSYTALRTGLKTRADPLTSFGTSEFNFQGLIKVKC